MIAVYALTYPNTRRHNPLRHPNVMTEAQRLALPDPCRPIDEPVVPVRTDVELYMELSALQAHAINTGTNYSTDHQFPNNQTTHEPIDNQSITNNTATKKAAYTAKKSPKVHQSDMADRLISVQALDIRQFIQQQQQQAKTIQAKHPSLQLPLSLLPGLINDSSLSLMKEVMSRCPHIGYMNTLSPSPKQQRLMNLPQNAATQAQPLSATASQMAAEQSMTSPRQSKTVQPSQPIRDNAVTEHNQALLDIEAKLYLMGQMYHIVLCIFLLCQCKSRQSLNPQITLQDLADAINQYIQAHRTELYFLTQHDDLHIEPTHIELAALAMDWQVGKQANISQRTTTISSNNPLTGG